MYDESRSNSFIDNASWEANDCLAAQEILAFYGT
jgi:hypothetical protein